MKVADYIANYLYARGVSHIFELVGGMLTNLVDALYQQKQIQVISVHHEQAAAFAAEAYARMTGIPGVAMATSGPGATNLLTGIGSCFFDSVPVIFITGQVNRSELKGQKAIRQLGFQETDIINMARPITKAAWLVESPEQIPGLLSLAFEIAGSGRPGPVLLDIPMDIQRGQIEAAIPSFFSAQEYEKIPVDTLRGLIEALKQAKKPLILAGGGLRSARAIQPFRKLVDQLHIPVVNSLMAGDALPYQHPYRVGLIGSYGNRWANLALGEADFLLVLGSRLDIRQTGSEVEAFKGERVIYHVDVEPGEINNRVKGVNGIVAHLIPFLHQLLDEIKTVPFFSNPEWLTSIQELRAAWPDTLEIQEVPGINPNVLMHQLSQASRSASAFAIDVGQHQMWAGQSLEPGADQRLITSGGMGAMGSALPYAMGICFADRSRPVVMVAGDGGFQLNLQELQTIFHHQLSLKMVVLNNHCHGMVRQFQQSYFDERYPSTYWGYSAPDFVKLAQAYGIEAQSVSQPEDVERALAEMWADPVKPYLLEVMIDTFANAYPKIAFGRPITEMEPFAKPLDMEGT